MTKETSVISFSSSSSSSDVTVLEIDPNLNLDTDGNVKSSFEPGETVYIALHYDRSKYQVKSCDATTGSLTYVGAKKSARTISQQFVEEASTALSYIINSVTSITWYGVQGTLAYSYNTITPSILPCMLDLKIVVDSDIYLYTPDSYVSLLNTDSYPVGVEFILESI